MLQQYNIVGSALPPDSAARAQLGAHMHRKDSVLFFSSLDSIAQAKQINWNNVLNEAAMQEEKKAPPDTTTSIFKGHLLKGPPAALPAQHPGNGWMLAVILCALLILSAVRQWNNRRLVGFISAFFASRFAMQLQREEYAMNNRAGTALLFSFVLVMSLFVFQALGRLGLQFGNIHPLLLYFFICMGITGVYLVKIVSTGLLGFIFEAQNEAKEYIFYILLFNQLLGLLLLPLVTGIAFIRNINTSFLVYIGLD